MSIRQVVLFDQFSLLNIRIVFLSSAFVHLAVTAVVTLRIDTTVDEDPRIQAYHYIRWKLITFWFNVITLVYLPARLYADWLARRSGSNGSLVTSLNHATDVVMTSLLFPMTLYFDIVFWYIFTTDPALLAPTRVFEVYLPYWAQHSLHTVSIAVVLLDLVLTPRKRPESLRPRVALLLGFISIYSWMVYGGF